MTLPKFIRKAILQVVGMDLPIETKKKFPIPREQFEGFSEKEIDEIVLGSSFPRIEELRNVVLDHLDVVLPKGQGVALRKIINNAFNVYTREEAEARSMSSR